MQTAFNRFVKEDYTMILRCTGCAERYCNFDFCKCYCHKLVVRMMD